MKTQHTTITTYKPSKGVQMDPKSKTQLAGYVPSEKRVADLLMAGLIRSAAADTWYDSQFDFSNIDDFPEIPPLPRAFASDLADVSMLAKEYKLRSAVINDRIQTAAAQKGGLQKKQPPVEPVAAPTQASEEAVRASQATSKN